MANAIPGSAVRAKRIPNRVNHFFWVVMEGVIESS